MTSTADIDARRELLRRRFAVWQPRTLSDWLDDCAERHGERPMVLTDDRELSYADISAETRCLADGLAALGVRPGDRVAMVMANYPEFVAIKFAIARAGAIAVPLNYLYRSDELHFVLADSGCRVVITMTGFADQDYQAMLDGIPDPPTVVLLDTDGRARPGVLTVKGLAALGERNRGGSDGRTIDPLGPGDMLYTSGTTGSPKGVLVSHDAVLRTAFASALTRAYQDGRRILFSLPCYHMFGYVEGLLSASFVGGAVIPQTRFSADGYFAGIQRHRATDILCVPTMAVAMIEHPARGDYDLSSLTAILCGSAPAPIWLWKRIQAEFGVSEIVTGYGMTEAGGAMTLTRPEDPLELTSNTVGCPKMPVRPVSRERTHLCSTRRSTRTAAPRCGRARRASSCRAGPPRCCGTGIGPTTAPRHCGTAGCIPVTWAWCGMMGTSRSPGAARSSTRAAESSSCQRRSKISSPPTTRSVRCSRSGYPMNVGARLAVSSWFRLQMPLSPRPRSWQCAVRNSRGSKSQNAWFSTVRTICRPRRRARCRSFDSCNSSAPQLVRK
jgi:acyl-CoA synthetase (AMP-forming)/AMP-acid ligase II